MLNNVLENNIYVPADIDIDLDADMSTCRGISRNIGTGISLGLGINEIGFVDVCYTYISIGMYTCMQIRLIPYPPPWRSEIVEHTLTPNP